MLSLAGGTGFREFFDVTRSARRGRNQANRANSPWRHKSTAALENAKFVTSAFFSVLQTIIFFLRREEFNGRKFLRHKNKVPDRCQFFVFCVFLRLFVAFLFMEFRAGLTGLRSLHLGGFVL